MNRVVGKFFLCFLLILASCTSHASGTPIAMRHKIAGEPFRTPLIVIDPGHGGENLGAHGMPPAAYQEKHFNLRTARELGTYLRKLGFRTLLTRNRDVFIPLKTRARIANQKKGDLFISIHYNASKNKNAEGVEVYYCYSEEEKDRSKTSKRFAEIVLDRIVQNTHAKKRKVKHANFVVLRETTMPAILVEGGFLTNDSERKRLQSPLYLKHIAWGIAQGVQEFFAFKHVGY